MTMQVIGEYLLGFVIGVAMFSITLAVAATIAGWCT